MNLNENTVYIVKDGKLKPMDKPKTGYGKTIIHWQDGKITYTEVSYTIK